MSCSWHGETPRDKGEKLPRIVKEKPQCFGPEHETWKKNLHVFGVLMTILCINLVHPSFLVVAIGVAWCQRQPHPVGAANSLRFLYFVIQNLDLLNWVGGKKWEKYSPKGGDKWWFTRICKTKITNSTKEERNLSPDFLGKKKSRTQGQPPRKARFPCNSWDSKKATQKDVDKLRCADRNLSMPQKFYLYPRN